MGSIILDCNQERIHFDHSKDSIHHELSQDSHPELSPDNYYSQTSVQCIHQQWRNTLQSICRSCAKTIIDSNFKALIYKTIIAIILQYTNLWQSVSPLFSFLRIK